MNLKIEPFAVFWAGQSFVLPSLRPFCGKKICILSNGFLPPRFAACAEELIGGEGSLHEEGGAVLLLSTLVCPLIGIDSPIARKARVAAWNEARIEGLIDPLRFRML